MTIGGYGGGGGGGGEGGRGGNNSTYCQQRHHVEIWDVGKFDGRNFAGSDCSGIDGGGGNGGGRKSAVGAVDGGVTNQGGVVLSDIREILLASGSRKGIAIEWGG